MGLLGALKGSGSTRKDDIGSTKKHETVSSNKERSVYYYPNYNSFQNGDHFESVIRGYFPETFYDLVNSTITSDNSVGRNDEQTPEPKYRFRHKLTGDCFWVECKFVGRSLDDKIQLAANDQLISYEQFQENHRSEMVYLVIGFGGSPHRPKSLYCISLEKVTSPELCLSSIEKYKHRLDQVFRYENGSIV
jgi:hypothetical protein